MIFIGIDISKKTFNTAIYHDEKYDDNQFENNQKGFKAFLTQFETFKENAYFCLEATGIYGLALATFLIEKNQKVIVENPIRTHAFCEMEMSRNKTDKADARSIARYCNHLYCKGDIENRLYHLKEKDIASLQDLVCRLEQLGKIKTQETNRLQVSLNKEAARSIKAIIKVIELECEKIQKTIKTLVKQNESLEKKVKLLTSISGFGDKTAWVFLASVGDITLFSHSGQLTSYAGLNPKIAQSGTSVHHSSLSKMGNRYFRKALYMPALTSIRHNPLMKDFYQRLIEKGKPKKVALCAVMRKLLVIGYGVLKSGKPFDPCYGK